MKQTRFEFLNHVKNLVSMERRSSWICILSARYYERWTLPTDKIKFVDL